MSFKDNLDKFFTTKNILLFSILFTLNYYYFKFSTYESISYKIKIPELIYLLFFQFFFFQIIKILITKISEFTFRKILDCFIKTWFLVIIVQTCFYFYGITTLNDFLETVLKNLYFEKNIFIKPLKILLPYFISFLFVYFFENKNYSLLKFFKITTVIFIIFFFYREIFLYPDSYFTDTIDKKSIIKIDSNIKESDTTTLWVLFDEYDPNFIKDLKLKNNLKYFNNFKKESIYFNNIIPNAKQTKFSTMGILTGFNFEDISIKNKEVFLLNDKNEKIRYDFNKTIFQKIIDNSKNFAILSTVTKYCSVYFKNYELKNCYEYDQKINLLDQLSLFNHENYNGIFFHYALINYVKNFYNLITRNKIKKKIDKKLYQEILELENNFEINDFDGKNFITVNKIRNLIDKEQYSLIFAHVYLPHLPSNYSEKKFNFKIDKNENYAKYLINLKYNDLVIKKLLELQNEYNKLNLIISSDHWFREKDKTSKKYYESLLAVKLYNEKDYYRVDKKYNASIVFHIIDSIVNNKSHSHKKIIQDISSNEFANPCYNKNCLD